VCAKCQKGMPVKASSWLTLAFGSRKGMPVKASSWSDGALGLGRICWLGLHPGRAMLLRLIFIACMLFEENASLKPLRPLPGEERGREFYSSFN